MSKSQNGWPALTSSAGLEPLAWVTGRVLPGDVWTIFDYLCRRFDAEVEPIRVEQSWGWANRAVRGATTTSNHASGTAIDLNAPAHPLGKRGTFTAKQVKALRAILADLDGVIRWGGDYQNRADEMHFEVVGTPAQIAKKAAQIKEYGMALDAEDMKKIDALIEDKVAKRLRIVEGRQIAQGEVLFKANRIIMDKLNVAQADLDTIEAAVTKAK